MKYFTKMSRALKSSETFKENCRNNNKDPLVTQRNKFPLDIDSFFTLGGFPAPYQPNRWDGPSILEGLLIGLDPDRAQIGINGSGSWDIQIHSQHALVPELLEDDVLVITKSCNLSEIKCKVLIVNAETFICDKLEVTEHVLINTGKLAIKQFIATNGEIFTNEFKNKVSQTQDVIWHIGENKNININNLVAPVEPKPWDENSVDHWKKMTLAWAKVCRAMKKCVKNWKKMGGNVPEELWKDLQEMKSNPVFPIHGYLNAPEKLITTDEEIQANQMDFLKSMTPFIVQMFADKFGQEDLNLNGLVDEFDKAKMIEILLATGMDKSQIPSNASRKDLAAMIRECIENGSKAAAQKILEFRAIKIACDFIKAQQQQPQQTSPQTQTKSNLFDSAPATPDHNIIINQGRVGPDDNDDNYKFSPDGADQQQNASGVNPNSSGGLFTGA